MTQNHPMGDPSSFHPRLTRASEVCMLMTEGVRLLYSPPARGGAIQLFTISSIIVTCLFLSEDLRANFCSSKSVY